MRKAITQKGRLIKFVWALTIIAGLSGAAFGATFTVTKTADTNDGACDADCSLREAIAAANAAGTDDTINFDAGVFAMPQMITLGGTHLQIGVFTSTPTPLAESLTINGPGANLLTINGNNLSRVFAIYGITTTMSGVTVTGGRSLTADANGVQDGGGILYAGGTLNLLDSVVTDNQSRGGGGGIVANGALNLTNVTVTNNQSAVNYSGPSNTSSGGGGIRAIGKLSLNNVTVSGNTTFNYGGGIFFFTAYFGSVADTSITLTGSTVTGNRAYGGGGGVYADNGYSTFTNSNISNNVADGTGGGLHIFCRATTFTNSIVSNNRAGYNGGGIYFFPNMLEDEARILIFNSSILSNNLAVTGGGIYAHGRGGTAPSGRDYEFYFNNSTVNGNTASGDGAGVYNRGVMSFTNSTISNNSGFYAYRGGGVMNSGKLTLTNSTVSGNSARTGGGIYNLSDFTSPENLILMNTTIAKNIARAGVGGGIVGGGVFNGPNSKVHARNTIIADNAADADADFSGALISQGYNLIENTSGLTGTVTTDITGQDPQLFPLGSYGGATRTHTLTPTSPAIDKGSGVSLLNDQRGQARQYDNPAIANAAGGDGSDIGSFERQTTEMSLRSAFDFDGDGQSDISVFRPSNGAWYLQQSSAGFTALQFGLATDKITPADYDGDGITDVAVFRDGAWYLQRSQLGFTAVQFGLASDKPVAGDFDGDGWADIAVYRAGTWYIQSSQFFYYPTIALGEAGDKPVPADYDGDGKTDVAVFKPSNGAWHIRQSTAGFKEIKFGLGTDLPVPADYDGDGRTDVAVFRNGVWYLNRSAQGFTAAAFGLSTDKPIPSAYVP